jgi:hypothetical protein
MALDRFIRTEILTQAYSFRRGPQTQLKFSGIGMRSATPAVVAQ